MPPTHLQVPEDCLDLSSNSGHQPDMNDARASQPDIPASVASALAANKQVIATSCWERMGVQSPVAYDPELLDTATARKLDFTITAFCAWGT